MVVTVADIETKRKKLEQLGKDLAVAQEKQRSLQEQLTAVDNELVELCGDVAPADFLVKLDDELAALNEKIQAGLDEATTYIDKVKGAGNGQT